MKSFDKETLVGVLLIALVFAAVAGLYYIKLDNDRWNKEFQTDAKLEAYRLETDRKLAESRLLEARVEELKLIDDKGMVIR